MVSPTPRLRLVGGTALAALAALFVTVTSSAVARAETPGSTTLLDEYVDLPLTTVTTTLVDATHHQIFVAGATSDADLVAVSPGGDVVHQIALAGVTQMALDDDANDVYAAVPGSNEIAVVDTSTYQVTLHPTPNLCAQSVAPFGEKVWFAAGCDNKVNDESLQILDLATDAVQPAFTGYYPQGYYFQPTLNRVPGTDDLLVGTEDGTDLIDTGQPKVIAHAAGWTDTNDVEFAHDGSSVYVYHSGGTVSLPSLEVQQPTTTYGGSPPDGGDPDLVFTSGNRGVDVFDRISATEIEAVQLEDFTGASAEVRRTALTDGVLDIFAAYHASDGTTHARLYLDRAPSTPGPVITAPDAEGVVTHPVTINGSFTYAGDPVASVVLTLRDEDGKALGTATTAADGTWSFTHAWATWGPHPVFVQSPASGTRKAAMIVTAVDLARRDVALTVDSPTTAAPNQTVHVTGTMTVEGSPAAGETVGYYLRCIVGESVGTPSADTTATDDNGGYTFDVDPGRCAQLYVGVYHDADSSTRGFDTSEEVDVSWHVYRVQLPDPHTVYAGSHYQVDATVTLDGEPASGVPVLVTIDPYPHTPMIQQQETTDAAGTVPLSFDTTWTGNYYLDATVDGDDQTLGDYEYQNLDVPKMPSTLNGHTDVDHTSVGKTVTISGTLTHPQGDSAGDWVQLTAIDQNNPEQGRAEAVEAGPDGSYAFNDIPLVGGTTTYYVYYTGTSTKAAADTVTTSVTVDKLASSPTLTSDRTTYHSGDIAHLHVDLGYNAPFTLTGTIHGVNHLIEKGYADADGANVDVPMTYTETFKVSTDGDLSHAGATSAPTRRTVAMLLHPDPAARTKPVVFAAWMHPRLRVTEQPARPGTCVRFQLQRRTTSGWVGVVDRDCLSADAQGVAAYHFTRTHRTGVLYRYRASFAGDDRNLATRTAWIRFRFRST